MVRAAHAFCTCVLHMHMWLLQVAAADCMTMMACTPSCVLATQPACPRTGSGTASTQTSCTSPTPWWPRWQAAWQVHGVQRDACPAVGLRTVQLCCRQSDALVCPFSHARATACASYLPRPARRSAPPAGIVALMSVYPMETIRTRQALGLRGNFVQAMAGVARTEGVSALYKASSVDTPVHVFAALI